MILKHNRELFTLFHNLINYERAYFEQYSFPYRKPIHNQIKSLKAKFINPSMLLLDYVHMLHTLQGVAERKHFLKYERRFWYAFMLAVHMDSFQRNKDYISCVYGYLCLDMRVHLLEGGIRQTLHMVLFREFSYKHRTLDNFNIFTLFIIQTFFLRDDTVCSVLRLIYSHLSNGVLCNMSIFQTKTKEMQSHSTKFQMTVKTLVSQ